MKDLTIIFKKSGIIVKEKTTKAFGILMRNFDELEKINYDVKLVKCGSNEKYCPVFYGIIIRMIIIFYRIVYILSSRP